MLNFQFRLQYKVCASLKAIIETEQAGVDL